MNDLLILITGGSSGIGKAAAKELHKLGATIIIQARNLEKLASAAAQIDSSGKRISYYSTDLTDQDAVESSAQEIIEREGLPDVIINSAGAGEWLSFQEANVSHFKDTINSPYMATTLTCKVFYDKMQVRGNGHFILVNSAAAYFSFPGAIGYTPARWALLGFARSLQADLHRTNFLVSMVVLGKVDTPYFTNNPVSENRIPKMANWLIATMSAEEAGHIIARTVETKKSFVYKPLSLSLLVFLNRLFPGLFRWLLRITGHRAQR